MFHLLYLNVRVPSYIAYFESTKPRALGSQTAMEAMP